MKKLSSLLLVGFLIGCDGGNGSSPSNMTPVANAGPDQNVVTGSIVTLDGSASTDANGDSLTYSWSVTSKPAGSAAVLSSATAVRPAFTADRDGAYVFSLIVNDGQVNSAADTVKVTASLITPMIALPKTGQTVSYAVGDDGDLEKGISWPSPRFTDNGNGTATDNLTGLMWLKDTNCMRTEYPSYDNDLMGGAGYGDGAVTWQNALDFIKGINNGTFSKCGAGYADWRMPNVKELRSLVDYSKRNPALPAGHPFSNLTGYWSSTSSESSPWEAWVAWPHANGRLLYVNKITPYVVWPVRTDLSANAPAPLPKTGQTKCYGGGGNSPAVFDNTIIDCPGTGQDGELQAGVAWPFPRFIANTGLESGCVTDNFTGLMWARSPDNVQRTWGDALDFTNGLSLCGHADWRLPNIDELETLVGWGETSSTWLEREGFASLPAGPYWSSTTEAPLISNNYAWISSPNGSSGGVMNKLGDFPWVLPYVWPVRGR